MKRLICIIITITTILTLPVSASPVLTDEIIKDLNKLEIMIGDGQGNMRLEDNVTRAEFSKMICVAMGFKTTQSAQIFVVEDFYDVTQKHWAYGYIQIAKGLSLIDGVGKGYFNLDGNIKIQDAIKIIVAALGYGTKVEKTDYPTGYLRMAEDIGLTSQDEFLPEKIATRKEIASLISGALDIPLLKQTSFGSIIKYEAMDGKDGRALITLRINLTPEEVNIEDDTPRFNGPEYVGRVLKITNLKSKNGVYYFNNALDENDNSLYMITENTYIYLSSNTLELDKIKDGMYMQCWHYTDAKENIELLKVELMKEKPAGI